MTVSHWATAGADVELLGGPAPHRADRRGAEGLRRRVCGGGMASLGRL